MQPALAVGTTLSGPYAALGRELQQAVEMAVQDFREETGLVVRLEVRDDAGSVERGCEAAHELCGIPSVLGVVGHFSSDVSIAGAAIYREGGLALVSPIASNPVLTDQNAGSVFRFTNRDDVTGRAIAKYLTGRLGKRRAVLVTSQYAYGRSMATCFERAFSELGGTIVAREPVEPGRKDFHQFIRRISLDFDTIFYGGAFEGAPLLKALREAGYRQLFAAGDGCWDLANFLDPAGAAATEGEGVLVLSATPQPGDVPGSREFVERYTRRYGRLINYAVNSYDSARLLLNALRDAGHSATREAVVHALRTSEYPGIAYARPVTFDAKGDNRAAVTALHTATSEGRFQQVAVLGP